MAKISFQPIGSTDNVNIYLRLSIDRKNVFRRKTGFTINPKDWSKATKLPKQSDAELKKLKDQLESLRTTLQERYNGAISKGTLIDGNWLQEQINFILGKRKITDLTRLDNYFDHFIANLPNQVQRNNKKGVSQSTIQKYKTAKRKIEYFEAYTKKKYYLKDINLNFRDNFISYLRDVECVSDNYTGRLIKFVKTVCINAKVHGLETHHQLDQVKGYTVEAHKIYLTFEELEAIEQTKYNRTALDNAKDWLIIGCFIGQRVSDLLPLTADNIHLRNGVEYIELVQQKTQKRVTIPLHHKVKEILERRNGAFPRKISDQRFNEYIKDVAKLAGINQPTKGAVLKKIDKDGKKLFRKEYGTFPKYELVTSHICRRSFASNFYGEIPTVLLKVITAHSTEQQFLNYIGKTGTDYAQQLAEYWTKEAQKAKKEPQLNVIKKAQ